MNVNFENAKSVDGGYELKGMYFVLNSENWDNVYKISLGTGTAWLCTFIVDARDESESISRVVQFCIDNEYSGLYMTFDQMEEEADDNDEGLNPYDYAEYIGWYFEGDTNCFIDLQGLGLENLGD